MTYYLKALTLWAGKTEFDNQTKMEVLGMILRREYRLHWLRG